MNCYIDPKWIAQVRLVHVALLVLALSVALALTPGSFFQTWCAHQKTQKSGRKSRKPTITSKLPDIMASCPETPSTFLSSFGP